MTSKNTISYIVIEVFEVSIFSLLVSTMGGMMIVDLTQVHYRGGYWYVYISRWGVTYIGPRLTCSLHTGETTIGIHF